MRMYDIIEKKRDGKALSDEEIKFFIEGYTKGEIPDYQASALCMAIYFRGMNEAETVTLTECMAKSGDNLDLSMFGDLTADKHSTGGVGDKTTLIVRNRSDRKSDARGQKAVRPARRDGDGRFHPAYNRFHNEQKARRRLKKHSS